MKFIRGFLFLFFLLLIFIAQAQKVNLYNITDFGAVADSITVNTKSIQSAIDKCSAEDGGIVVIPAGNFVSGTILIKNNVNLQLERVQFC